MAIRVVRPLWRGGRIMIWRKRRNVPAQPSGAADPPLPVPPAAGPVLNDAERWIGHVDRIDRSSIVGWACDRLDVDRSVRVEAILSNGLRAETTADLFRQDILDAGIGTGRHGFLIDLTAFDLTDQTLAVRFVDSGAPLTKRRVSFDIYRELIGSSMPPGFVEVVRRLAEETRDHHRRIGDAGATSRRR